MNSLADNVSYIISAVKAAANKLRSLSGSTAAILPENLATEIQSVYDSKTPNLQNKNVELTLAPQAITKDAGYDGLNVVSVGGISEYWDAEKVVTPDDTTQYIMPDAPKLCIGAVIVNPVPDETKTVIITQNGSTIITPTSGKWIKQATVTVNVPHPTPVEPKDYNFFDWDGTLLYAYSADEINALTELPALPIHEGLTGEWNYTLAQLKSLTTLSTPLPCNVGALYQSIDNISMLLWISIPEGDTKRDIDFSIPMTGGGATIQWGDTTSDTVTVSDGVISASHTYSGNLDYMITVTPNTGYSFSLINGRAILGTSARKRGYLRRVVLGKTANNILMGNYCYIFNYHPNLEFVSMGNLEPNTYTPRTFFDGCSSLKAIHFPSTIIALTLYASRGNNARVITMPYNVHTLHTQAIVGCTNLRYLTLPASLKNIYSRSLFGSSMQKLVFPANTYSTVDTNALENLFMLKELTLPTTITSIPANFLVLTVPVQTTSATMSYLYIPPSITSFGSNAMSNRSNSFIRIMDFRDHTTVPTLSNSTSVYATTYVVPDNLYEEWIAATNWVGKAANIVKVSEYND